MPTSNWENWNEKYPSKDVCLSCIINLTPCTYVQKHCTNACNNSFSGVNPRCIYHELDQFKILVDTTRSKIWSFLMGILLKVWRQFWHFLADALAMFKTIAWYPNPSLSVGCAVWLVLVPSKLHKTQKSAQPLFPPPGLFARSWALLCKHSSHPCFTWVHFYPQNIYL